MVFFFHMVVSTIRIRLVLRLTKDLTKRDQETCQSFLYKTTSRSSPTSDLQAGHCDLGTLEIQSDV